MRRCPSPNHDARADGRSPEIVVLHYTDMRSASDALRRLTDPASRVSSHYLIGRDGEPVQLVDEERRAWHAGLSGWAGAGDVNSRSIGIELDSPGHRPEPPEFPAPQIAALIDLLDGIRSRWPIARRNVVAHSDVAPERKIDPGERFPWARVAAAGHALFVDPETLRATHAERAPTRDDGEDFAGRLRRCGYMPERPDGPADLLEPVTQAFHRRHLASRLGAPANAESLACARALAALVTCDVEAEATVS